METAGSGVDKHINSGTLFQQFLIVAICFAAEFVDRLLTAFRQFIGNCNDLEIFVSAQTVDMNAPAAAALTAIATVITLLFFFFCFSENPASSSGLSMQIQYAYATFTSVFYKKIL